MLSPHINTSNPKQRYTDVRISPQSAAAESYKMHEQYMIHPRHQKSSRAVHAARAKFEANTDLKIPQSRCLLKSHQTLRLE